MRRKGPILYSSRQTTEEEISRYPFAGWRLTPYPAQVARITSRILLRAPRWGRIRPDRPARHVVGATLHLFCTSRDTPPASA